VAARLIGSKQRLSNPTLLIVADGVGAAAIAAATLVSLASLHTSAPLFLVIGTAVVGSATVAWRRAAPYPAALVALVSVVAYQRLTHQAITDQPPFAVLLTIYTAAARGIGRREIGHLVGLVGIAFGTTVLVASNSPNFSVATVMKAALPVVVAPAIAGLMVAWRRSLTRRLALTRALIEDEQELRVARAVADERNRLAREVHDVVAHAVSVMVIQAGVARLTLLDDPPTAESALRKIVTAGREAIAELRRMIVPARPDDGEAAGQPPRIGGLRELAQAVSGVGLATKVVIEGTPSRLSEDMGQLVYRVVQEALTNALKHSGGGSAVVTLHVGDGTADVRIVNRAVERAVPLQLEGAGHGLVGMAERVTNHGGTLRARELFDGAFEVWAQVPLVPDPDERSKPGWPRTSRIRRLWFASAHWRPVNFAAATLVALELDAVLSSWRRGSLAANVVLVGGIALVTLWRRDRPLAACVAINALAIPLSGGLANITQATIVSTFVFVVPVYSVAAWASLRPAAVGLAVTLAALISAGVWHHAPSSAIVGDSLLTLGLWAVGRLIRQQRTLAADLERASAALLADRSERQQAAISAERDRIVIDLQASVTREVNAMVAVAEALLGEASFASVDNVDVVATIELSGRTALAQMRHVLGVLRSEPTVNEPHTIRATSA
jgi:signal transduction histidine kinase